MIFSEIALLEIAGSFFLIVINYLIEVTCVCVTLLRLRVTQKALHLVF